MFRLHTLNQQEEWEKVIVNMFIRQKINNIDWENLSFELDWCAQAFKQPVIKIKGLNSPRNEIFLLSWKQTIVGCIDVHISQKGTESWAWIKHIFVEPYVAGYNNYALLTMEAISFALKCQCKIIYIDVSQHEDNLYNFLGAFGFQMYRSDMINNGKLKIRRFLLKMGTK